MKTKRIINALKNLSGVEEGFHNFNNENKEIEEMAKERLKTCKGCIHFVDEKDFEPNPIFRINTQDRIEDLSAKTCSDCGCVLSYKLRISNPKLSKNCKL